jgi:hypothetical protein
MMQIYKPQLPGLQSPDFLMPVKIALQQLAYL